MPDPLPRGAVFVDPRLVVAVRYTEVTERGLLRQPVLLGLRTDSAARDADHLPGSEDVGLDESVEPAATPAPAADIRTSAAALHAEQPRQGLLAGRRLHQGRSAGVLRRASGRHIAPYLRDRPVVLTRYPDGIDGKSFFQKNAPEFIPDWVPTCRVEDTEYFLCNERDALLYVINMGCIPLHVWSARRGSIERPDWSILDLDPKGAPRRDVIAVARRIHALLEPARRAALHQDLGPGRSARADPARRRADPRRGEVLRRGHRPHRRRRAARHRDVARPLGDRGGKVYVDFLQNGFGKTIAAPFSVRPRPGAPVSTPLTWNEVTARLDPARYTIRTVPDRVAKRGDPLRAVLDTQVDIAAVIAALQAQLHG